MPAFSEAAPEPDPSLNPNKASANVIRMSASNFEALVPACFQGAICEFDEPPWDFFEGLKISQHPQATETFIAYLRSKLVTSEGNLRYGRLVKQMIADYYPKEQENLQFATYFAYEGDLKKALALYREVEKEERRNQAAPKAPALNIANVLYELKRPQEALPYYRLALAEVEHSGNFEDQRGVADFLRRRIEEIAGR